MSRTQFLARLFGLLFLVFAVAFAVNGEAISGALAAIVNDRALLITWGMVILAAGLAVVLTHNLWRGVTAVLVSLIGWASVLKGVFLLCVSPALIAQLYGRTQFAHTPILYAVVMGAIGLLLTYGGFRSAK